MIQRRAGNRYILIGVGLIALVLLLGLFLIPHSGGSSTSSSNSIANGTNATQPVVFATQSIPEGTTFRYGEPLDSFFAVRQMPPSLVPAGAYASLAQIENAIRQAGCQPANQPGCTGQVTTTQTIYQDLPVVSGMFSSLGAYRSAPSPAFTIPYGYVAVSLDLTAANAVAGSIKPGDTVDLMASYNETGAKAGVAAPSQTQYIMTNVKVIGIGTLSAPASSPSTNATPTPSGSGSTVSLVILARYQQALVIQHLKDFGWQLSAVLRSARETASIPHFKTAPVTDRWFFVKSSNPFKTNPGY